jgi:hypothetical protein
MEGKFKIHLTAYVIYIYIYVHEMLGKRKRYWNWQLKYCH